MLLHRLSRFDAFSGLGPDELTAAAAHARALTLPAGRWLVRPGRELSGSYFLDRGRVRLWEPDELVDAGSPRSRHPVYPGARGVATITAVELLRVDTESLAGLPPSGNPRTPPLYESTWLMDGWEFRFLGTRLMQRLGPGHWQRILRGMRRIAVVCGERVVTEGEPGEDFYVLRSGRAGVCSAGRCVARLDPGDFFGEDALITGARRNATVTMLSDGSVMALAEDRFRADLLPLTITPVASPYPLVPLSVGDPVDLRERMRHLDGGRVFRIVGGTSEQRALTAFILAQRGFRVGALE